MMMGEAIYSSWKMKKAHDNRPALAKFLDQVAQSAAQTPEDIPNVYRDLVLDLFMSLSPDKLKELVTTLAKTYNQPILDDIQVPGWEKGKEEKVPF